MTDSLALVQSQHVARSGEVRQVQLRLTLASPKLPLSVRATRCKHLLAGQVTCLAQRARRLPTPVLVIGINACALDLPTSRETALLEVYL